MMDYRIILNSKKHGMRAKKEGPPYLTFNVKRDWGICFLMNRSTKFTNVLFLIKGGKIFSSPRH